MMFIVKSLIVIVCALAATSKASLLQDFFASASNFWPGKNDVSAEKKEIQKLPKMSFELPQESEDFIKAGLMLINAPRDVLDVCTHRVIHNLKKNCNQLNLEEISKLGVMMLNCQLEIEGRQTFPCKPEMTLQQCTMGMNSEAHQAYSYMTHRAVGVCSALKQDQYRALAELTVNRLMQAAQSQVAAMNEALKTQRRLNDMETYNLKEFTENGMKIKENQEESLEKLRHAESLIEENLVSLEHELHLRQKAEETLGEIEKSTEDIGVKLVQHTQELHEGHEKLIEGVNEISRTIRKNNDELIVHYEETLAFLENFKSIIQISSQISTNLKSYFEGCLEAFPELGLKISDDFLASLLLNSLYFICGMIYMVFINAGNYSKMVLIALFAFNSVAAAFKTKTPLLPVNLFVWFAISAFKLVSAVSRRVGKVKYNIKFPSSSMNLRPTVRKSHESDDSDDSDIELDKYRQIQIQTVRPSISQSPTRFGGVGNVQAQIKIEPAKPTRAKETTPITSRNTFVPGIRPMTPQMKRVLRESISEAPDRPATPFQSGMNGRTQCQALTMKNAPCRNAAIVGFNKCRVHN